MDIIHKEGLQHLSSLYRERNSSLLESSEAFFVRVKELMVQRERFEYRQELVEAISEQYGQDLSPTTRIQLEMLRENNCYTVTTGHQLGLFGGPLFFTYKILSVVAMTRKLKQQFPESNFVPVFWMATEDHDFEEISGIKLFNDELKWETEQSGAVGRFNLEGFVDLINQIDSKKGTLPYAEEWKRQVDHMILNSTTLTQITRRWVDHLFHELGLVCIDGDDPKLKRLFTPHLKKEIFEQPTFPIVLKENEELEKQGYGAQVTPREINLFYLSSGSRKRIVQTGVGEFAEFDGNKSWSRQELEKEVEAHPENFSPNVLIRPLYQETILPNLIYQGGPGELSYWMQLPKVFEHYQVSWPIVWPRTFAALFDKGSADRLSKLGIQGIDLWKTEKELVDEYLQRNATEDFELDKEKENFGALFDQLLDRVVPLDGSLEGAVKAERQKLIKYLEGLEGRLKKAEKQKHETALRQINTLKEKFFTGGDPQERVETILPYYWKYSKDVVIDLLHHFDPLDPRYHLIFLD